MSSDPTSDATPDLPTSPTPTKTRARKVLAGLAKRVTEGRAAERSLRRPTGGPA